MLYWFVYASKTDPDNPNQGLFYLFMYQSHIRDREKTVF